jgi:phage terminase Nu1 subunit (DNA packaging protein)
MLDLITSGEAGIILGCSGHTVNRWADAGILPAVGRVGRLGTRVFDRAAVEKYARKQNA